MANGQTIIMMAKELLFGMMELNMKVILKRINIMVLENILGIMAVNMKENGVTEKMIY